MEVRSTTSDSVEQPSRRACVVATVQPDETLAAPPRRISQSSLQSDLKTGPAIPVRLFARGLPAAQIDKGEIVLLTPLPPWELRHWRSMQITYMPSANVSLPVPAGAFLRSMVASVRGCCVPQSTSFIINDITFDLQGNEADAAPSGARPREWGVVTEDTRIKVERVADAKREVRAQGGAEAISAEFLKLFGRPYAHLFTLLSERVRRKRRRDDHVAPLSILIHGPRGTGKTSLVRFTAQQLGLNVHEPWAVPGLGEESEQDSRPSSKVLVTDKALAQDALVLLDDLDQCLRAATPAQPATPPQTQSLTLELRRALRASAPGSRKLNIMIGISSDLSRTHAAAAALFDFTIRVEKPGVAQREAIFAQHLTKQLFSDSDMVDFESLADAAAGLSGADIATACREALAELALDMKGKKLSSRRAVAGVQSALRRRRAAGHGSAWAAERSGVRWTQVGGCETAKRSLEEAVVLPFRHPAVVRRLGLTPPRGVLLFGPPGTGKTLLARAVAGEARARFLTVSVAQVARGEVGASCRVIREVFEHAADVAPCVIFLDEMQALFARRGLGSGWASRVVSQLLLELDRIRADGLQVVLLAATNAPRSLDPALLRPGRLDRHVYVGPPNATGRLSILRVHTQRLSLGSDVDLEGLVQRTEGFTGADLRQLCQAAGLLAVMRAQEGKRQDVSVQMKDFQGSIAGCRPSDDRLSMARDLKDWSARVSRMIEAKEMDSPLR